MEPEALGRAGTVLGQLDIKGKDGSNLATTYFSFLVIPSLAKMSEGDRIVYINGLKALMDEIRSNVGVSDGLVAQAEEVLTEAQELLFGISGSADSLQNQVAGLRLDLQAEAKTRSSADSTLQGSISAETAARQAADGLKEDKSNKGVANGYVPTGADNKIPLAYFPEAIMSGQNSLLGNFNASTAVATLTANGKTLLGTTASTITLTNNTAAITGYTSNEVGYYRITTAGTFAGLVLSIGDFLVADDSGWAKQDNTDVMTGVKGDKESSYRTGNVNLTPAHIGAEPEISTLPVNKGGTGVQTVAGQSSTQRKVFASPKSTTAAAPSFTALDKYDVGLDNVVNLDTSQAANIQEDAEHRFVTDAEKSKWNSGTGGGGGSFAGLPFFYVENGHLFVEMETDTSPFELDPVTGHLLYNAPEGVNAA
jgi:hypothetical protein